MVAFEMLNAASSHWLPVICNFPTSYPELPFSWGDAEHDAAAHVAGLRDSVDLFVKYWSNRICQEIAYINLYHKDVVGGGIPAKVFVWAAYAKGSRSYNLPGGAGLAPAADLLNHDALPHVSVKFEMVMQPGQSEEQALPHAMDMILARDVMAGQEILSSYGTRCRLYWLTGYGFLPPEPEEECVDN